MENGARLKSCLRSVPTFLHAPNAAITRNSAPKACKCSRADYNAQEKSARPTILELRIGGYFDEKSFQPPCVVHCFRVPHCVLCDCRLRSKSKSGKVCDFGQGRRDQCDYGAGECSFPW